MDDSWLDKNRPDTNESHTHNGSKEAEDLMLDHFSRD
jgi:hypothetical protein